MKNIEFFSKNKYIVLPSKSNPRVYLAVDNKVLKINSFQLYNPFSVKGKVLKKIAYIFPYFNIVKRNKTGFVLFLEDLFNTDFVVSQYISTDKNTIILQLQSEIQGIYYLKFGLNSVGNMKVSNEIKALKLLSNISKANLIKEGSYQKNLFLITKQIIGRMSILNNIQIKLILEQMDREKKFVFLDHPRVKKIHDNLLELDNKNYLKLFLKIKINDKVKLVYEHGDFTPWNIIQDADDYILFDFENFVEEGIELFDYIRYNLQVERLIYSKTNKILIESVLKSLDVTFQKELLTLYLLKEVINRVSENSSIEFEDNLLNIMDELI